MQREAKIKSLQSAVQHPVKEPANNLRMEVDGESVVACAVLRTNTKKKEKKTLCDVV